MSLADDLEGVRAAVGATPPDQAAVTEATASSSFADATVQHDDSGVVDYVDLKLVGPRPLEELEGVLGAAHQLPRLPSGGSLRVQFNDTVPDTGVGATVVATLDDDGKVVAVMVRRDDISS